jgi:iron-sulfur cluster repair protein YtfE (RIC family)
MKATQLLKKDHAAVKKLFAEFARTTTRAPRRREDLLDKIAKELDVHTKIEEEIFYPAVKKEVPRGDELVDEAKEEHEEVDRLLAEAQGLDLASDELTAKVREIREAVIHHATEEEQEMFPMAERELGDELTELGERLQERKRALATSSVQRMKLSVKKALRKVA